MGHKTFLSLKIRITYSTKVTKMTFLQWLIFYNRKIFFSGTSLNTMLQKMYLTFSCRSALESKLSDRQKLYLEIFLFIFRYAEFLLKKYFQTNKKSECRMSKENVLSHLEFFFLSS